MAMREQNRGDGSGIQLAPVQLCLDGFACLILARVDERHLTIAYRDDGDAGKAIRHDANAAADLLAVGHRSASHEGHRE